MEGPMNAGDEFIMDLPPGFRFHPTDEEIITHYLTSKVINNSFSATAIGEADLNKCEPWDLPKKAKMGEKEWYFFCQRDRKYPTGMRTNRATESGYWKATGKDKEIYKGNKGNNLVGMKKTLVFYKGRAPKGEKTNWVMHEYRLEGKFSYYNFPKASKDEWVVSRVFHKNTGIRSSPIPGLTRTNSFVDALLDYSSLPPLMEPPYSNNERHAGCSSFITENDEDEEIKGKGTASSSTPRSSGAADFLSYLNNNHINHFMSNTSSYTTPDSIFNDLIPNPSFLHRDRMEVMIPNFTGDQSRQCKMEHFSSNNQSMVVSVSQDTTGLSTDNMTANEISSISDKEMASKSGTYYAHQDLEDPCHISDLDYLLNY